MANVDELDDISMTTGSGGNRKKKGSKVIISMIGIVLIIFVLVFAYFKLTKKSTADEVAAINQGSIAREAGRLNNNSTDTDSEALREAFREEDIERAQRSAEQGRSSIPRLMRDGSQRFEPDPKPAPEPEPAPAPEPEPEQQVIPEPYAVPAPPPAYEPPDVKSGVVLKSFLVSGEYSPGNVDATNLPANRKHRPGNQGEGEVEGGAAPGTPEVLTPTANILPGTMVYAIVDVGANSDDGSTPVVASIQNGKWAGAKLIGGFQRREEKLVIQFNKLVVKNKKDDDGKVFSVSGYAINPDDYSPGMASSVDNHYLERWGGLIAASFLEGFGEAKSRSGSRYVYGNDNNPGQVINDYDPADEAWIAFGKVGEKLSDKFEDKFDMPPTVRLDPGTAIGVLFL